MAHLHMGIIVLIPDMPFGDDFASFIVEQYYFSLLTSALAEVFAIV